MKYNKEDNSGIVNLALKFLHFCLHLVSLCRPKRLHNIFEHMTGDVNYDFVINTTGGKTCMPIKCHDMLICKEYIGGDIFVD